MLNRVNVLWSSTKKSSLSRDLVLALSTEGEYIDLTMQNPTNKELAQLLISGKRKTVEVKNRKQATAVRIAGHRLGKVLSIGEDGKSLTLSDSKVSHRSANPQTVKRKAAARAVGAKPAPKAKRKKAKESVLD